MGGLKLPDDDRDMDGPRKTDTSRERDQRGGTGGSESDSGGQSGQEKERGDRERARTDRERDAPFREPDRGTHRDDDLAGTGTSDDLGGPSRSNR